VKFNTAAIIRYLQKYCKNLRLRAELIFTGDEGPGRREKRGKKAGEGEDGDDGDDDDSLVVVPRYFC